MLKTTKIITIILCIGAVVFAAGANTVWAQAGGNNKLQLTVGIIASVEELPVVLSKKETTMPLNKIDLKVEVFNSWTALEAAFRTGMVDAAGITVLKAFKMQLDNVPMKLVLLLHRKGSSLVFTSKATEENLRGKLIGVSGNDTNQVLVLERFLEKKGLRLGYDVRYILIPFRRAVTLLKEEKIGGFVLPEPYGVMAQAEPGLVQDYILGKDVMPEGIDVVLIINPKKIAENRVAIAEWISSIVKSGAYIEDDKRKTKGEQVSLIQHDILNIDPALMQKALGTNIQAIDYSDLYPNISDLEKVMKKGLSLDILSGVVKLSDMVDTSFTR
ncbi:MAG: ABC transporter substrate-binding protein [Candidatus Omnitrophica bacterium]|nr:ABC transporter substrate-binding protein [Candidatus Omnitrophota bacterium]MBU1924574.1 ABC transporter substrate-binding protein [Candidatus Omnitrophota bacterium]